jgi:hypothetical protein
MDISKLNQRLRFLQVYAVVSTVLIGVALWAAFTDRSDGNHFEEIEVERINLVEPDGTLRMLITSAGRFPRDHREAMAGMLFFNSDGIENGGLVIDGSKKDGKVEHTVHLSMDRYDQDQTVVLRHQESGGRYFSGLLVQDRPDRSIRASIAKHEQIMAMPEGPARDQALAALMEELGPSPVRLVVGRDVEESSVVKLADGAGHTRIRLRVTREGEARLEFLDAAGGVVASYPETR